MKKGTLTIIPFAIAAMTAVTATAQVELRDADLFRLGEIKATLNKQGAAKGPMYSRGTAATRCDDIEMIIRYDSERTLAELENNGAEIVSLVGTRTAIVSLPAERAEAVAASKGVRGAKLAEKLKRTNNNALKFSNVTDVHSGTNLSTPYDGTGVVIGLFDTGIDPNHINFRDAQGENRIKMMLHYTEPTALPDIYDTPAKIMQFDADTRSESHGTHVLGIMGGSFVDTENPESPDLRGVAPGAEIVAAAGEGYNVQILDSFERIGRYAKEQGKPCVINLSFGDNLGPHDGSDEFTEAINDIAEKYDAVICMAGGNERDVPCAIIKGLSESNPYVKTLALKGSSEVGGYFQSFGPVEIWTEDSTPFEVTLDIISKSNPDEAVYSFTVPTKKSSYVCSGDAINDYLDTKRMDLVTEGTRFQEIYADSFMGGICGVDPYNNRYNAQINMCLFSSTASNSYRYFTRITVKGEPGKKIFMYCNNDYMSFGNRNIPGLDIPDGAGTNSNIGSGPNTIAVGSYVTANVKDSGYDDGTIGDISYFSSYGETTDGRIMPDICAPGQVIISSRNSYASTTGTMAYYYPLEYSYYDYDRKQTYYWTSCAGTSQASPHMAGIAALWRQANPQLSYSQIIDIARRSAAEPGFDSVGWGHGKVDAMAGIKMALAMSDIRDMAPDSAESIMITTDGNGCYEIFAAGQKGVTATIYSMQGAAVESHSTRSDTLTLDTTALPSGAYVLKATSSYGSRTLKFMVK